MHKRLILTLALGTLLASCSGMYSSPEATIKTMQRAAKKGNEKAVMSCYTQETQKLLQEVAALSKDSKKDGDRYDRSEQIAKEEIEFLGQDLGEEKGTVAIRMKESGMEIKLRFLKENGSWKIDQAEELKAAISMLKGMKNMKGDLNNFLNALSTSANP